MAETEATLRLKAVLDTTEVQQKLQQLRGGQAQGPMGSQPPAGIAAQQGNLGGLSQTLSKLNTSITQLRQSIDRLNGRFQGQF